MEAPRNADPRIREGNGVHERLERNAAMLEGETGRRHCTAAQNYLPHDFFTIVAPWLGDLERVNLAPSAKETEIPAALIPFMPIVPPRFIMHSN